MPHPTISDLTSDNTPLTDEELELLGSLAKAANPIITLDEWDEVVGFYKDFLTQRGQSIFDRILRNVPGPDKLRRREMEGLFREAYSRAGRSDNVSMRRIYDFDPGDIRVADWAAEQAGEFIRDINAEQLENLRRVTADGVRDGVSRQEIERRIRRFMGLDRKQTQALQNFYRVQREQGVRPSVIDRKAKELSTRMLSVRAERIARTETARAIEAAKLSYWKQAADAGLIKRGEVWRVWKTHPDERRCPYCAPLDGKRTRIGGVFTSSELGSVDHPPLHVNCRCWADLEGPGLHIGPGGEIVSKLLEEIDSLISKHPPDPHATGTTQLVHGRGGGVGRESIRREMKAKGLSGSLKGAPDKRQASLGDQYLDRITDEQWNREYDKTGMSAREFIDYMAEDLTYTEVNAKTGELEGPIGNDSLGQRFVRNKDGQLVLSAKARRLQSELYRSMEKEQGDSFASDKQVLIFAGLPGAGKTHLWENVMPSKMRAAGLDPDSFLYMNADEVKRHLINGGHVKDTLGKGLRGMELAQYAHEESSFMFKRWKQSHTMKGTNMVLDITALNEGKTLSQISELMAAGYTVHMVHADINAKTALASALKRFVDDGEVRNGRPVHFPTLTGLAAQSGPDPIDKQFPKYASFANGKVFDFQTYPIRSTVRFAIAEQNLGRKLTPDEMNLIGIEPKEKTAA